MFYVTWHPRVSTGTHEVMQDRSCGAYASSCCSIVYLRHVDHVRPRSIMLLDRKMEWSADPVFHQQMDQLDTVCPLLGIVRIVPYNQGEPLSSVPVAHRLTTSRRECTIFHLRVGSGIIVHTRRCSVFEVVVSVMTRVQFVPGAGEPNRPAFEIGSHWLILLRNKSSRPCARMC